MEQLEAKSPDNVSSFRFVFRNECDAEMDATANASREQVIMTTFVAAENEWVERLTNVDLTVSALAWAHLEELAQSFSPADAATDVRSDTWTPIKRIAWAYRFDPQRYPVVAAWRRA